jgi:predicted TIM-barrel fold metal-dependent hydrolase
VIDDHTHQFPLEFAPLVLEGITLDLGQDEAAAVRRRSLAPGRLHLHLLQSRLSDLLGVDDADVVSARDEIASADWTAWVRRLFDDADIAGMVMDEPLNEPTNTAPYAAAAGRPVWSMGRIDPLVDDLLGAGASAVEIVASVEKAMDDAVAAGCVAFKTAMAYRTGLAVDPIVDAAAAQRSIDAERDVPVRRRAKPLRDLVMRTALGCAADLDRPLQFHTGFGDSDIRLAESDPLLLEELLRTPEGKAARVVLIHGSFPWHQKAAYLASVKPNVWVELSLSNLFAPVGVADRLIEVLDLAPRDRILLGSDGHGVPETHWFGCRVLADAWRTAEHLFAEAGARRAWLDETRTAIFETNARAVYGLST